MILRGLSLDWIPRYLHEFEICDSQLNIMSRYAYTGRTIKNSGWDKDKLNELGKKGYKIIQSKLDEGEWSYTRQSGNWYYSGDTVHVKMERDSQSIMSYEYYIGKKPSNGDWRHVCSESGKESGGKHTTLFGRDVDERIGFTVSVYYREWKSKSKSKTYNNHKLSYLNYNDFQGHDGGAIETSDFDSTYLDEQISLFFEHLTFLRKGDELNELICDIDKPDRLSVSASLGAKNRVWFYITLYSNNVEAFKITSYWEIKKSIIINLFVLFLEDPRKCAAFLTRKNE